MVVEWEWSVRGALYKHPQWEAGVAMPPQPHGRGAAGPPSPLPFRCLLLLALIAVALAQQCPPGTWSSTGNSPCTKCGSSAPYAPAGSTSSAACVACTDAACNAGDHGVYPCVTPSWTLWYDTGVELSHSCLLYVSAGAVYGNAKSACANKGAGYHLLTSRQVCAPCLGPAADASWCHGEHCAIGGECVCVCVCVRGGGLTWASRGEGRIQAVLYARVC